MDLLFYLILIQLGISKRWNFRSQDFRPGMVVALLYLVDLSFMTVSLKTLQEMDVGMKIAPKDLPPLYTMIKDGKSGIGVETPTFGDQKEVRRKKKLNGSEVQVMVSSFGMLTAMGRLTAIQK